MLRIFEMLYAKVLVPDEGLLQPKPEDQTPSAKELFEFLFPAAPKEPVD